MQTFTLTAPAWTLQPVPASVRLKLLTLQLKVGLSMTLQARNKPIRKVWDIYYSVKRLKLGGDRSLTAPNTKTVTIKYITGRI